MLRKVRTFVHILVLPFSRYWSSFCPGPCSQCWRCSIETKVGVRARMWLVLWGRARKPEAGKEGPKGKCVGMRWKGGWEGNRWAGGTQHSVIEGLGFYVDGEGKHFSWLWADLYANKITLVLFWEWNLGDKGTCSVTGKEDYLWSVGRTVCVLGTGGSTECGEMRLALGTSWWHTW